MKENEPDRHEQAMVHNSIHRCIFAVLTTENKNGVEIQFLNSTAGLGLRTKLPSFPGTDDGGP
jgi:hypothetical protein